MRPKSASVIADAARASEGTTMTAVRPELHNQQGPRPPAERLVRRRLGPRGHPQADGATDRRPPAGAVPHRGRQGRGPGGRLLAPAGAAVHGQDHRQGRDPVPVPRHRLQLSRPLRLHAGPGDHQPQRDRAVLSGGRAPPLRLGVAGRPDQGRSGAWSRTCTRWTPRSGQATARPSRRVQLPAGAGQPDGPHPRGVRPRLQHRAGRAQRVRLRGHPR